MIHYNYQKVKVLPSLSHDLNVKSDIFEFSDIQLAPSVGRSINDPGL